MKKLLNWCWWWRWICSNLKSNEEAIEIILEAITKAGYEPGKDMFIAIDAASSEYYKDGKYVLEHEGKTLTPSEMVDF